MQSVVTSECRGSRKASCWRDSSNGTDIEIEVSHQLPMHARVQLSSEHSLGEPTACLHFLSHQASAAGSAEASPLTTSQWWKCCTRAAKVELVGKDRTAAYPLAKVQTTALHEKKQGLAWFFLQVYMYNFVASALLASSHEV